MMSAKVKMPYHDSLETQHSKSPITTGTSVLGVAFDKGVIIAADQLISYGSLARFRNVPRVSVVNKKTVIGCGGDYADYQGVMQMLEQKVIEEACYEDGYQMTPSALHSWMTRIQYRHRSKFDPLWCSWMIGGLNDDGKPYLGLADRLGTAFTAPHIASGFGNHLALPLMRQEYDEKSGKLTLSDARELIHKCMQVLYYRDARSWNQYSVAIVDENGSRIEGPFEFGGEWNFATMVTGYE